MLHIVDAEYLGGFRMRIVFSDGKEGVVDLEEWLEKCPWPSFLPLRDPENFKKFHLDYTIVWENGLDLAPEFFYYLAFRNDPDFEPLFRKWGYLDNDTSYVA